MRSGNCGTLGHLTLVQKYQFKSHMILAHQLEMIFLDLCELSEKCSISHYSPNHNTQKTPHYVKEISPPLQYPLPLY